MFRLLRFPDGCSSFTPFLISLFVTVVPPFWIADEFKALALGVFIFATMIAFKFRFVNPG
ncbi:hypothetical protein HanXRQr2_Chr11g0511761 [Helianthus annuus]|uniref:Uncharacterized protein n=1 Tax=Helianthus annuus TaxID=4232 RepID=A0A9K3HSM7_HELAN|nr:hypothetical protein HanXRQr2_Chr11g0511761 [Helianthus annuus]KAJ0876850.1 hypothetical protein HanPSC8_Chr11g0493151 [Helianthus annuus]